MIRFHPRAWLPCVLLVGCDPGPSASEPLAPDDPNANVAPIPVEPFDVTVPVEPVDVATPGEPTVPEEPGAATPIVSRYHPMEGVGGVLVRVLTYFSAPGCAQTGECSVTIGGVAADIIADSGSLEVLVPRFAPFGAGELCVTWRGATECGGFEVSNQVGLSAVAPARFVAGAGDTVVQLTGSRFPLDAEVELDGWSLETNFSYEGSLSAVIPAELLASEGSHWVIVRAPSASRCGAISAPFEVVVDAAAGE